MASVDNRVVRMEFDNAAFERKIHQTMQSLSQLDKSLKLTGAQKGLQNVSAEAKKVDLTHIGSAVEGISGKFIALSTIAITALSQITSAAIRAGASFAKSLSLDPLIDGFQEYEMNIGSIQTILANTKADGTNLQQVNDALDELNEYSDKTIYNFGQMTKNIGTFTAAGVDLDTSVQSIKGISNLAAISGSSAEQASTAMYQLSQAVSTGTLRLMDWNSVVNAGMGGEVFQKALFETGKAMGTLKDVPMDQTFDEWTKSGNSFRDSLQDGWLTGEVLTNTLKGFTGEMTEAQLLSIGYTKEQAAEILELGKTGVEAATKIRTFTQLLSTVKETVASGWSETFRTIFGNFEEATVLFTGLNDAVSNIVKGSAESRNKLLSDWKTFGGRGLLIEGVVTAFKALGSILNTVKLAFRQVFPPITAERLVNLTKSFRDFTQRLTPSQKTLETLRRIFAGFFSVLSIGFDILKGGIGFVKDLATQLFGLSDGKILAFAARIGDFFVNLREGLEQGNVIEGFFDGLSEGIGAVVELISGLKDAFFELFDGFKSSAADTAGASVDRFGDRFSGILDIFDHLGELGDKFRDFFEGMRDVVEQIGSVVGDWFGELGEKLAESMGPGEFDEVLDAFNTGLLAGIALLIGKWLKGGINVDFGQGLFGQVKDSLEQVTGVLEAMQTQIKADALLKIAAALALLTVSIVALSLINSADLTRALTAMAVGFAQLMGSFAILNAMDAGVIDGTVFAVIALGMIGLAGAVLILSAAVAIFSRMSWTELAKGLLSVTILLGVLTATAILLSKNSGSILLASVGMIAMGVAMNILAGAVAIFGTMELDTIAKGLGGVAAGLLIIAGAMHLMPDDMFVSSASLILVATAMNVLALAVKQFGNMELSEMGKGLLGIAAGLTIIGLAMHAFPDDMLRKSAGLLLVSVALNAVALAVKQFGGMSWTEMGKGLLGLGASLLIIAVALRAMEGTLAGSAALGVASVSIGILGATLIQVSKVPFGELILAIGAIAIAIGVLVAAAWLVEPVTPALLALGVALIAVGGAFALFGVGAFLVAKAFKLLGEAGPEAAEALTAALEAIGDALPALLRGFAEGILEFLQVFVDAAPTIAKGIGVIVGQIIDTLTTLIPKATELFMAMVDALVIVVFDAAPKLIAAGIFLLITLLQGIKDNIYQITNIVLDIVVEFLEAVSDNTDYLIAAGVNVLEAFLIGIANSISSVAEAATSIVTEFISAVAASYVDIATAGTDALIAFLFGMTNNLNKVVTAVGVLIITFINTVTNLATSIATSGANAIVTFANGMTNNATKVATAMTTLVNTLINVVVNAASRIATTGANAVIRFVEGIGRNANRVVTAGVNVIIQFLQGIAANAIRLANAAADVVIDFLNALADTIREKGPELRSAGANIMAAVIDGMTGGLASKAKSLSESVVNAARDAWGAARDFLGIHSPSKLFAEMGVHMIEGLVVGLEKTGPAERSAVSLAERTTDAFQQSLTNATLLMDEMGALSPTITPVIDLSQVREGSKEISGYLTGLGSIVPRGSTGIARVIASTAVPFRDGMATDQGARVVKFEQNIHAPKQLDTAQLYRQTRNQITMAKEELNVA